MLFFYPDRAATSRRNAGVYLRMRHQQASERKAATATEKARQHPQNLVIKSKFERVQQLGAFVCWPPGNRLEHYAMLTAWKILCPSYSRHVSPFAVACSLSEFSIVGTCMNWRFQYEHNLSVTCRLTSEVSMPNMINRSSRGT